MQTFTISRRPELRLGGGLGSSHENPIDSLSLFSESPAIVCLFGARRLSQQSHPFFPEPRKRCQPVYTDTEAALFNRVLREAVWKVLGVMVAYAGRHGEQEIPDRSVRQLMGCIG